MLPFKVGLELYEFHIWLVSNDVVRSSESFKWSRDSRQEITRIIICCMSHFLPSTASENGRPRD